MSYKYNLTVIGVDTTKTSDASSIRVRNLLDIFQPENQFRVTNIVFDTSFDIPVNENIYCSKNIIKQCFLLKKLALPRNNILFCYGPPSIENILLIIFAKSIGYRIVFDIVENYFSVTDLKSYKSHIKNMIRKFLITKMPLFTDGCTVISTRLKKEMLEIAKNKFKVALIPISVRLSEFEVVSQTKNIKPKIIIFYGGSFGQKDGLVYLFDAFDSLASKYDHIELHLSGKGEERFMLQTAKLIDQLKNKEKIIMRGCLERDQYVECLLNSDILCMTRNNSIYSNHGFPFKLGEYLASGKAIIASNVGDVSNYLKDNEDVKLVKPESVEAIYSALEFFITNPDECIKMGNNAKNKAIFHFDSFKVGNELKSFLLSL